MEAEVCAKQLLKMKTTIENEVNSSECPSDGISLCSISMLSSSMHVSIMWCAVGH